MTGYAAWTLREREATLLPDAQREAHAYATAVGLAFDVALREAPRQDVRKVLNRISVNPAIYGVVIYDTAGVPVFASDLVDSTGSAPPAQVREVLDGADSLVAERVIGGQRVYSVLRGIHDARGRTSGVLEVAQPLDFIEREAALVRRRYLLNTVTLLATIALVTLVTVRLIVTGPLGRLVAATRRLGEGDLGHRVPAHVGPGELASLGRALNAMAGKLESARAALLAEAEERVALERRLQESEKMAAIGNLAAGVAHEIAAPLNVIGGRAELLLRRDDAGSAAQRSLQVIVQQIKRITTIVQNLLDFARRTPPRARPVALASLVDVVLEFLDHDLARRGVTVRRSGATDLCVLADPDQLQQVLVNLLLNAAQALESREGGPREVTLRTVPLARPDATEPAPAHGGAPAPWVALAVEDTGPGIAPADLPRLFDPFFSTKPRGTGLGLAVARSIVEEHGGRLSVSASEHGGARFLLVLPGVPLLEQADG
jgi:signal transduction histidine kinase